MSARAVGGFLPVLREVEAGLSLPIPDRVRILRELEADLLDLSERFVAQGLSPDEARARAREALVPDGEALRALDRLHTPLYRRLTRHVADDRLRMAERIALLVTTTVVVLLGTSVLWRVDLLSSPSPFLWPVLSVGGVLVALVATKAFQLWIKGDHSRPSQGLGLLQFLSAGSLGLGVVGVLVDFFFMAAAVEAVPADAFQQSVAWLERDSALLAVAILIALVGGLAWFVLAQWVAVIESQHREVLGLNTDSTEKGGG